MLRGWLLLLVLISPLSQALEDEWQGVQRIVAVGDIHGDYDAYMDVLQAAGIVNRRGNWIAGETHFVQVGDLPDRGPDTDRIVRHLMALEEQAIKAGGRVHALIGNHEAMNITGDLRYVHPGEYEALKSRQAKRLREAYYERVLEYLRATDDPPVIDDDFRETWMEEHPLGFVEHRQIWSPRGEFGDWVTGHNAVVKINDILFVHGGLSLATTGYSLRELNERVRSELRGESDSGDRLIESEAGPLWYRGLAQPENEEEKASLQSVLEHFDARHVVVGHTPGYGTVMPRYDARVLIVDSGISSHYGGHRASLLVEDGKLFVLQRGHKVALPTQASEKLEYFKRIRELEPDTARLELLIRQLESGDTDAMQPREAIEQSP
jgi:hypothetical protein